LILFADMKCFVKYDTKWAQ